MSTFLTVHGEFLTRIASVALPFFIALMAIGILLKVRARGRRLDPKLPRKSFEDFMRDLRDVNGTQGIDDMVLFWTGKLPPERERFRHGQFVRIPDETIWFVEHALRSGAERVVYNLSADWKGHMIAVWQKHLRLARPKEGECWEKVGCPDDHGGDLVRYKEPFKWVLLPGEDPVIQRAADLAVRCGCLRPVNFGKGFARAVVAGGTSGGSGFDEGPGGGPPPMDLQPEVVPLPILPPGGQFDDFMMI